MNDEFAALVRELVVVDMQARPIRTVAELTAALARDREVRLVHPRVKDVDSAHLELAASFAKGWKHFDLGGRPLRTMGEAVAALVRDGKILMDTQVPTQ